MPVLEGFLWRQGVTVTLWWQIHWQWKLLWVLIFVGSTLRGCHFSPRPSPTQQPVDFNAGMPQVKWHHRVRAQAHHQQTGCLKSFWARPCSPKGQSPALPTRKQDSDFPTRKPANLLDSLIHQRADSRSKKSYNPVACEMETAIVESQTKWGDRWRNKIKPQTNK